MMLDGICRRAGRLTAKPWVGCGLAAMLLIAFAAWTTPRCLRAFAIDPHPIPVALVGETIRNAVPPNTSVLLADSDIDSPSLWYYADRPIVLNAWTADAVRSVMERPDTASLVWSSAERWPFPPAAYLYPKPYSPNAVPAVIGMLGRERPVRETPDFWIVELRKN
jgi:hypothetical protein